MMPDAILRTFFRLELCQVGLLTRLNRNTWPSGWTLCCESAGSQLCFLRLLCFWSATVNSHGFFI